MASLKHRSSYHSVRPKAPTPCSPLTYKSIISWISSSVGRDCPNLSQTLRIESLSSDLLSAGSLD
jgi:hypothetical protein